MSCELVPAGLPTITGAIKSLSVDGATTRTLMLPADPDVARGKFSPASGRRTLEMEDISS